MTGVHAREVCSLAHAVGTICNPSGGMFQQTACLLADSPRKPLQLVQSVSAASLRNAAAKLERRSCTALRGDNVFVTTAALGGSARDAKRRSTTIAAAQQVSRHV